MKNYSLKVKIIIPTIIILIILMVIMTSFSLIKFTGFVNHLFEARTSSTAKGMQWYLQECERDTKAAAVSMSSAHDIINAMKEQDVEKLSSALTPSFEMFNIDFYTITDAAGTVILRTYDLNKKGDSIVYQQMQVSFAKNYCLL